MGESVKKLKLIGSDELFNEKISVLPSKPQGTATRYFHTEDINFYDPGYVKDGSSTLEDEVDYERSVKWRTCRGIPHIAYSLGIVLFQDELEQKQEYMKLLENMAQRQMASDAQFSNIVIREDISVTDEEEYFDRYSEKSWIPCNNRIKVYMRYAIEGKKEADDG